MLTSKSPQRLSLSLSIILALVQSFFQQQGENLQWGSKCSSAPKGTCSTPGVPQQQPTIWTSTNREEFLPHPSFLYLTPQPPYGGHETESNSDGAIRCHWHRNSSFAILQTWSRWQDGSNGARRLCSDFSCVVNEFQPPCVTKYHRNGVQERRGREMRELHLFSKPTMMSDA